MTRGKVSRTEFEKTCLAEYAEVFKTSSSPLARDTQYLGEVPIKVLTGIEGSQFLVRNLLTRPFRSPDEGDQLIHKSNVSLDQEERTVGQSRLFVVLINRFGLDLDLDRAVGDGDRCRRCGRLLGALQKLQGTADAEPCTRVFTLMPLNRVATMEKPNVVSSRTRREVETLPDPSLVALLMLLGRSGLFKQTPDLDRLVQSGQIIGHNSSVKLLNVLSH
jgi:hypothetical protein